MSIYRCNHCDVFVDDDYSPCREDPTDDLELICESCYDELSEQAQIDHEARLFAEAEYKEGLQHERQYEELYGEGK